MLHQPVKTEFIESNRFKISNFTLEDYMKIL